MKTFSDKVRDIVRKIPKGKTVTYKAVAAKAGNPKAARAVGAIMRTNYDPSLLQATAQCAATFVRAVGRPNNDPLDRQVTTVSRGNRLMMALTAIIFTVAYITAQFNTVTYSPRVALMFIRNPTLFHSFGLFTATFIFSLYTLAWVDRENSHVPEATAPSSA